MSRDVSFSLSPDGLVDVSSAMRATVPGEPYHVFAATWAKVGTCLRDARCLATASDRRVLARLEALTVLGIWDATALDVLPHPKIPGYCLVRARDPPDENLCRWTYLVHSADWLQEECVAARKVVSTLAWHFSMRENRTREFEWCRRAALLVQRMLRQWRYERKAQA